MGWQRAAVGPAAAGPAISGPSRTIPSARHHQTAAAGELPAAGHTTCRIKHQAMLLKRTPLAVCGARPPRLISTPLTCSISVSRQASKLRLRRLQPCSER